MESGLDVRQTSDSLTLRAVSRFPRSEILREQAVIMHLAPQPTLGLLSFMDPSPELLMLDSEFPEFTDGICSHTTLHAITAYDSSSCRNVASTSSADSS